MAWMLSILLQHYSDVGIVKIYEFLLHDSSVRARSIAFLRIPNSFPLCRHIACTLRYVGVIGLLFLIKHPYLIATWFGEGQRTNTTHTHVQ